MKNSVKIVLKNALVFAFLFNASSHALAEDSVSVPSDYQSRSACAKQDWLWQQIENSEYQQLPQWGGFNPLPLFFSDPNVTMDRESDVMPKGREKVIHTYGSAVKLSFKATANSRYTGVLVGAECGLARLSLAVNPDLAGVVPGIAIKFLVSGRPSVNSQLMNSLDGQGKNFNYFQNSFSNVIAEPQSFALKILQKAFERATKHPVKLSLDQLAQADENGVAAASPVAPYQLVLEPTAEVQFPAQPKRLIQNDLASVPAGTVLYRVSARATEGAELEEIGYLQTESRFVASSFGDRNLFFNHKRFKGE
jgi:hypothetical protein